MSSTIHAYCKNCEAIGPRIHRNAGGAVGLWPKTGSDIFDEGLAMAQWNEWIKAHEYCDFVMKS